MVAQGVNFIGAGSACFCLWAVGRRVGTCDTSFPSALQLLPRRLPLGTPAVFSTGQSSGDARTPCPADFIGQQLQIASSIYLMGKNVMICSNKRTELSVPRCFKKEGSCLNGKSWETFCSQIFTPHIDLADSWRGVLCRAFFTDRQ